MVHVGLDLSRTRLDVHVMDESGAPLEVSSPAFFGPGSYWSYATSWLFNQAS